MPLTEHLRQWLGAWPPSGPLDVVGSARRTSPGWDGRIHPAVGVSSPAGGVLSVAPEHVAKVAAAAHLPEAPSAGLPEMSSAAAASLSEVSSAAAASLSAVPALVGYGRRGWFTAVFRWSTAPAALPDAGSWVPSSAPAVPDWLHPFGGEVLVAVDPESGAHLAGVGIKRHDAYGHELSVVTAPAARGRGLARRLVAQAARRVLDEGAIPTYMHAPSNTASAAVADAAGFPSHGWTAFGTTDSPH